MPQALQWLTFCLLWWWSSRGYPTPQGTCGNIWRHLVVAAGMWWLRVRDTAEHSSLHCRGWPAPTVKSFPQFPKCQQRGGSETLVNGDKLKIPLLGTSVSLSSKLIVFKLRYVYWWSDSRFSTWSSGEGAQVQNNSSTLEGRRGQGGRGIFFIHFKSYYVAMPLG